MLEAILALVIIAILSTCSWSVFNGFFNRYQDDALQTQLIRLLQTARQLAQIKQVPIAICKSKDHQQCGGNWQAGLLMFVNRKQDGIIQQPEEIISVMQPLVNQGKLFWRAYPLYRDYILFTSNLTSQSDNGSFWYCHANHDYPAWAIVLAQSGNTRIVYPKNGVIHDSRGKQLHCAW